MCHQLRECLVLCHCLLHLSIIPTRVARGDEGIGGVTGLQHFLHMTPVHKGVVDRAVCAVGYEVLKRLCQEGREVRRGHFTAAHCEIAVLDLALATDVTVNC